MSNLLQRSFTGAGFAIACCWLLGFTVCTADAFTPHDIGAIGVAIVALAATATLSSSISKHMGNWQAAYNVGKEAGVRRIPARD